MASYGVLLTPPPIWLAFRARIGIHRHFICDYVTRTRVLLSEISQRTVYNIKEMDAWVSFLFYVGIRCRKMNASGLLCEYFVIKGILNAIDYCIVS